MGKLVQCVLLALIGGLLLPVEACAQYKITGRLANYDSLWQNTISLSAINSLSDIYFAGGDIVINKDSMDNKGYFTLSGNNLPDEKRIYRIDLTNQKGVRMLQNGPGYESSFLFAILDNHSSLNINCADFSKSSCDYRVEGSDASAALQRFEKYLAGLKISLFNSPISNTPMAKQYATDKFNNSIRSYCDTCKYPLVALMAVNEIMDFEKDYTGHKDYYNRFLNRMETLAPNSIYVKEFEKKLILLNYQSQVGSSSTGKYISGIIICVEALIIIFLLGWVKHLNDKIKFHNTHPGKNEEPGRERLFETLTRREKEILSLLVEDIQNKEIASRLNLEVSTIKTHIGKIYQKLSISNRNEVKAFEPYLRDKNEIQT